MKKTCYLSAVLLMTALGLNAQNTFPANGAVGIGTLSPNASALLEVKSTAKGFLPPRMTQDQRKSIVAPATGLMVYQTNKATGLYYYDGSVWKLINTGSGGGWGLTGNAGTDPSGNFIGTTDTKSLVFKVNNQRAGFIDYSTCCSGTRNTSFGQIALASLTTGADNTATGYGALFTNAAGNQNSAYGKYALFNNNANDNTAYGFNAMFFSTSGANNTAIGSTALQDNTTGSSNTAVGGFALGNNFTGSNNTGIGANAQVGAPDLTNATAIGANATVSVSNAVVLGSGANVGIGTSSPTNRLEVVSAFDGDGISLVGTTSLIGSGPKSAGFKLSDNVGHSGALGLASASNAWMSGVASGDLVLTNSGGKIQLGTGSSSAFPTMTIAGGKVGIGTFNPLYQLSVNGTIQSKEVRVETGWADFVFEKDYALRSLTEVEKYISANNHLPDIPSAKEIQENGLPVAEMQTKMMAKIEELTLYVIALQKQVDALKKDAGNR